MLIKIRFPNSVTVLISFVLTRWIINEFEKYFSQFYEILILISTIIWNLPKLWVLDATSTWEFRKIVNVDQPNYKSRDSSYNATTIACATSTSNIVVLPYVIGRQTDRQTDRALATRINKHKIAGSDVVCMKWAFKQGTWRDLLLDDI